MIERKAKNTSKVPGGAFERRKYHSNKYTFVFGEEGKLFSEEFLF